MSNRALVLWSLALTLPVQFLYVLANLLTGGGGSPACANFHGGGVQPCSFGDMLGNAAFSVLLIDILSVGLFFIVSASAIAFILAVVRKLAHPRVPAETVASDNIPIWLREKPDPWWKIW